MRFCLILAFAAGLALPAAAAGDAGVKTVVRVDSRSGKLVRSVVKPKSARTPAFLGAVERAAAEQDLPPELIHSVIQVESDYNPYAVSSKGARGLMQLIPATARRFGVEDSFDPMENIQGGARYLRYLLDLYGGDMKLALAAYNAGEGAVARYGDVPPYPETKNYVEQVDRRFRAAKPKAQRALEAKPAAPSEPTGHIELVTGPDGTVRYVSR